MLFAGPDFSAPSRYISCSFGSEEKITQIVFFLHKALKSILEASLRCQPQEQLEIIIHLAVRVWCGVLGTAYKPTHLGNTLLDTL